MKKLKEFLKRNEGMKKLKKFLKRNEGMIIFISTAMLGCYFATTYILLRYILENGIYVAN